MTMMNKVSCAVFSTLLSMSSLGCDASPESERVNGALAPLKIAGVAPGASMADVVDHLGKPAGKEESDGFITDRFVYAEVVVGFDEVGTVAFIESKSEAACILTEICPGAKIDIMLNEISRNGYLSEVIGEKLIINGDGCWGEVRILGGLLTR